MRVLHANLQADDHDSPTFLLRPDGRYIAMYSKHGSDSLVRYRISTNPNDPAHWQPEQTLDVGAGTTYSNLFRLSMENGGNGRIYNFHRALNWDPTVMVSDDNVYDGNGHDPAEYTLVFPGDADNVAWTTDIHLDENDYPYIAFSVQKNQDDQDHRYYYGR